MLPLLPTPGQEPQQAEEAQDTGARDYGYQSARPSHVWAFTGRIVPHQIGHRAQRMASAFENNHEPMGQRPIQHHAEQTMTRAIRRVLADPHPWSLVEPEGTRAWMKRVNGWARFLAVLSHPPAQIVDEVGTERGDPHWPIPDWRPSAREGSLLFPG